MVVLIWGLTDKQTQFHSDYKCSVYEIYKMVAVWNNFSVVTSFLEQK